MFGDLESESPRVPSPWDPFIPSSFESSSPEGSYKRTGIPRLVPEVEEGNVEYKLKLTNISPARFARLVTQLKWRLLEGGGQAYYELGVADSGALIGLSRADLEQSLETLEMMAGEIGASVIVVKEIEVPSVMVALADKLSGYLDPETGDWANKMSSRRARAIMPSEGDSFATPSATEAESDLSAADFSDTEDSTLNTPGQLLSPQPTFAVGYHHVLSSNPHRPTAQSSPSILPLDDDLALFSMEPEPDESAVEELVLDAEPQPLPEGVDVAVDLEIASVYKPRPFRRRMSIISNGPVGPGQPSRRAHKVKYKKHQPWHSTPPLLLSAVDTSLSNAAANGQNATVSGLSKQEARAANRRAARDKRREQKKALLSSLAETNSSAPCESGSLGPEAFSENKACDALVEGLEALHVTSQTSPVEISTVSANNSANDPLLAVDVVVTSEAPKNADSDHTIVVEGPEASEASNGGGLGYEPRLIVEALVVRKMSIEEAFLDFGGFALSG